MNATPASEPVRALVGGVGQLYQGDLDLGRRAVERLASEQLAPRVLVEDLHYGAVAVTQLLEDLQPGALILVGAERRGRPPGTVERRRIHPREVEVAVARNAVGDAVTGYVSIDLVVDVAGALGALPARTVAVEVEPAQTDPGEVLSEVAQAGLEEALERVRAELRRLPLFELSDQLRALVGDGHLAPTPAVEALERLLAEIAVLEREGRWGRAFTERDRLRMRIGDGETGEGMDHRDWALWWALIEELDRLQGIEAVPGS